jgi:hypothetical protein
MGDTKPLEPLAKRPDEKLKPGVVGIGEVAVWLYADMPAGKGVGN